MISNPSQDEKYIIFKALARMIETNSGVGFNNADQGHPAYASGVDGHIDDGTWGDSPERNLLFKLLASFDREFHQEVGPDLSTWQKFCSYAVEAYHRAHSG